MEKGFLSQVVVPNQFLINYNPVAVLRLALTGYRVSPRVYISSSSES